MSSLDIQVFGGFALLLLVAWQLSTGMRWINLGRNRVKIHRYTGISLAVVVVPHFINGLLIAGLLKF